MYTEAAIEHDPDPGRPGRATPQLPLGDARHPRWSTSSSSCSSWAIERHAGLNSCFCPRASCPSSSPTATRRSAAATFGITWTRCSPACFCTAASSTSPRTCSTCSFLATTSKIASGTVRFLCLLLLVRIVAAAYPHLRQCQLRRFPALAPRGQSRACWRRICGCSRTRKVRTLLFIGPFILVPRIAAAFLIVFWFASPVPRGRHVAWARQTEQTSRGGRLGPHRRLPVPACC